MVVSSLHIYLYLPGQMPKFCKSGLTVNKEPTSVAGSPPVYRFQQSVSLHSLSHRLSLVLQLSQRFAFSEVNERDSLPLACCWPTSNCWTQLSAHKLEVSARSWPGKRARDSCDNRYLNAMGYICLAGYKARIWHTRIPDRVSGCMFCHGWGW